MKNLVLFAALTVLGIFGISSCSNDGSVTSPTQGVAGTHSDAFSANYTLPSNVTDYFTLNEGTLEQDLTLGFSPEGHGPGHMPPPPPPHGDSTGHGGDKGDTTGHMPPPPPHKGDMGNGPGPGGDIGRGIDIGRTLFHLKLTLTADQKVLIGDAIKAYHDCMKAVMDPIKLQRDEVIKAANVQRKAIMDALKAGTIDRATAKQQLKDLNTATKAALDLIVPDPTAGCSCLYTLIDSIGAGLTADQKVTWDAWVATLAGPCFPRP
jgi:hypothetical protein